MSSAIFISTFCEYKERHDFLLETFESFLTNVNIKNHDVYVVNDGSSYNEHNKFIKSLEKYGIFVVEINENRGIARTKNACIKLFSDFGYKYGFLVDDDILYKKDIFQEYIRVYNKTNIEHFSMFIDDVDSLYVKQINGENVTITPYVNGCLLTITDTLIKNIGGFPVLPYKYGYEHGSFSTRAKQFNIENLFYDIDNVKEFADIHLSSSNTKSIKNIDPVLKQKNLDLIWTKDYYKLYLPIES